MPDEKPDELLITIMGVEYPFPSFDTLTYKEARFIKRETGLVMGQFFKALEQGDPDALVAVALIAKQREGNGFEPSDLDNLLLNDIDIVYPKVEEAKEDPASPLEDSTPGNENEKPDVPPSDSETSAES